MFFLTRTVSSAWRRTNKHSTVQSPLLAREVVLSSSALLKHSHEMDSRASSVEEQFWKMEQHYHRRLFRSFWLVRLQMTHQSIGVYSSSMEGKKTNAVGQVRSCSARRSCCSIGGFPFLWTWFHSLALVLGYTVPWLRAERLEKGSAMFPAMRIAPREPSHMWLDTSFQEKTQAMFSCAQFVQAGN